MVSRDAGKRVVWPYYFDKNLTREQGRRVAKDIAVEDPRPGAIANAARTLGLHPEIEENAKPPREWHTRKGRVVIDKTGDSKESVLQQIARRL